PIINDFNGRRSVEMQILDFRVMRDSHREIGGHHQSCSARWMLGVGGSYTHAGWACLNRGTPYLFH
ncbi:MAG: hypothetical protein AAB385_03250, partial [Planctomycetota bacterium]